MRLAFAVAALALASPAAAEVRSVGSDRFEIELGIDLALDPLRLHDLLGQPARWWSDAHTFSGKAANLYVEMKPTGCWCEKMPDGSERTHMRVGITEPGRRLLLMGLLGPLSSQAKAGTIIWSITPKGRGTTLVLNYKVAGMTADKAAMLAPAVDRVLGEQLARLQKTAKGIARRR